MKLIQKLYINNRSNPISRVWFCGIEAENGIYFHESNTWYTFVEYQQKRITPYTFRSKST